MIKGKPCIFCNAKTKCSCFQKVLKATLDISIPQKTEDDIIRVVESFNYVYNKPPGVRCRLATIQKSKSIIHLQ